jgi:hypothetical protein
MNNTSHRTEPSAAELLGVEFFMALLFVATFSHFKSYLPQIAVDGDNAGYINIAHAIRSWHFEHIMPKLFWGTSYAIAGFSTLFHLSESTSLLLISLTSCIGTLWLSLRLWGGWVAAFFAVLSIAWVQRVFLAGSEPLFVVFIFSSLWMVRKEKWLLASFIAALATIVRPAGFFCLAAIGTVLIYRREYLRFCFALLIGTAVGLAYIVPLWINFGDPLATYHGYRGDWDSGSPIGLPFYAILKAIIDPNRPMTNVVLNTGWVVFSILGIILLFRKSCAEYRKAFPVEVVFAALYLIFLFTYNSSYWSFSEFPRFAIPVIPMLLVGFRSFFPERRAVIWLLATLSAVLAALSAVGIHKLVPF